VVSIQAILSVGLVICDVINDLTNLRFFPIILIFEDQKSVKMTRFLSILLFIIILFTGCRQNLLPGCAEIDNKPAAIDPKTLTVKQELDSLIHFFSNRNPDSAIFFSEKLIRYFDTIGCQAMIFDSYFYLSEIYLHVKPNDFLATYYFSEGVKIMVKNNIDFAINPFLLIDIGNLLYRHRLYQQAIEKYRIAVLFAKKSEHKYAEAVAHNNMGLSYQKIQREW